MSKRGNYIQFGVSVLTRRALRERNLEPGSLSRTINEVAATLTMRQVAWLLGTEQRVRDTSLPFEERFDTLWVTPTPEMLARATYLDVPPTKLLRAAAIKLASGKKASTRSKHQARESTTSTIAGNTTQPSA